MMNINFMKLINENRKHLCISNDVYDVIEGYFHSYRQLLREEASGLSADVVTERCDKMLSELRELRDDIMGGELAKVLSYAEKNDLEVRIRPIIASLGATRQAATNAATMTM